MTTTQEDVKRLTDEQRQQMRDFQAENHRILTPADYWMGAQDSLAALSQQAAQEPQPVATVSGEVKRVNNGPGNFWNVGAILVPDGVTLEPGTKLYTAAPAKPADSLEQILADLRARRDATTGDIRSAYNAVCDRLDVLISHLSAKPAEQEKACGLAEAFFREAKGTNLTIHDILPRVIERCAELEAESSQQAPSTAAQEQPQVEGAK